MALSSCQMSQKIILHQYWQHYHLLLVPLCNLDKSHSQRQLLVLTLGYRHDLLPGVTRWWQGTGGFFLEASFSLPSVYWSAPAPLGAEKTRCIWQSSTMSHSLHSLASEAEDNYSCFLALPRLTCLWSPYQQQLLQILLPPSLSTRCLICPETKRVPRA